MKSITSLVFIFLLSILISRTEAAPQWQWTPLFPASSTSAQPKPRRDFAMDWDQKRQRLLLFGGRTVRGAILNDLWTHDLATGEWTLISDGTNQPNPPRLHSMQAALDSRGDRWLLFGGTVDVPEYMPASMMMNSSSGDNSSSSDMNPNADLDSNRLTKLSTLMHTVRVEPRSQLWSLDLRSMKWSMLQVHSRDHSKDRGQYAGVGLFYPSSSGHKAFLMSVGGWNAEKRAMGSLWVVDLQQKNSTWIPLSSRNSIHDVGPLTGALDAVLLPASSSSTSSGSYLAVFGGCRRDTDFYRRLLPQRYDEYLTEDCANRNVFLLDMEAALQQATNQSLVSSESLSSGSSPAASLKWIQSGHPCIGPRKYAQIGAWDDNTLVLFGGRGTIEWGDGLRGQITVYTFNKTTGEAAYENWLPGLFFQSDDTDLPSVREGHRFLRLDGLSKASAQRILSEEEAPPKEGLTNVMLLYGGEGPRATMLDDMWILKQSEEVVATPLPCELITSPILALQASLVFWKFILIHGAFMFNVFALFMPIDVLVALVSITCIFPFVKPSERLPPLFSKRTQGTIHARLHLINGIFLTMASFLGMLAILDGSRQWFWWHVWSGLGMVLVFYILLLTGLMLRSVGRSSPPFMALASSASEEDRLKFEKALKHYNTKVLVFRWIHKVLGYLLYALGVVGFVLGVGFTLRPIRLIYFTWLGGIGFLLLIAGVYASGILHRLFPWFTAVDNSWRRRIGFLQYKVWPNRPANQQTKTSNDGNHDIELEDKAKDSASSLAKQSSCQRLLSQQSIASELSMQSTTHASPSSSGLAEVPSTADGFTLVASLTRRSRPGSSNDCPLPAVARPVSESGSTTSGSID